MRWIEIIQVRTVGESALDALAELLCHSLEDEGLEVTVYRHATVPTDLAVHLAHETGGDGAPDRTLGERLAATLGELGLVSHSLWVEAVSWDAAAREGLFHEVQDRQRNDDPGGGRLERSDVGSGCQARRDCRVRSRRLA